MVNRTRGIICFLVLKFVFGTFGSFGRLAVQAVIFFGRQTCVIILGSSFLASQGTLHTK